MASSHESIFHAERCSSTNSEENDNELCPKTTISPIIRQIASINLVGNNENVRNQLLAPNIGSTPILYGHGTALTTNVEEKSSTTMSTKVSSVHPGSTFEVSLARTSIPKLLGHRNSFDLPLTVRLRSPRRRKSFSADDLVFIMRSYHEACAVIERTNRGSLQIHDIYAQPRTPIFPPIERPPTPSGMLLWTAVQSEPIQNAPQPQRRAVTRTQHRLQHFLGIRPSSIEFSSSIPVPIALQHSNQSNLIVAGGRTAPSPLLVRVASRFRPTGADTGRDRRKPVLSIMPALQILKVMRFQQL
jgi:hypothetical protein